MSDVQQQPEMLQEQDIVAVARSRSSSDTHSAGASSSSTPPPSSADAYKVAVANDSPAQNTSGAIAHEVAQAASPSFWGGSPPSQQPPKMANPPPSPMAHLLQGSPGYSANTVVMANPFGSMDDNKNVDNVPYAGFQSIKPPFYISSSPPHQQQHQRYQPPHVGPVDGGKGQQGGYPLFGTQRGSTASNNGQTKSPPPSTSCRRKETSPYGYVGRPMSDVGSQESRADSAYGSASYYTAPASRRESFNITRDDVAGSDDPVALQNMLAGMGNIQSSKFAESLNASSAGPLPPQAAMPHGPTPTINYQLHRSTAQPAVSQAPPPQHSRIIPLNIESQPSAIPSGNEPNPTGKEYCTFYLRNGQCDYMQRNCQYKHHFPSTWLEMRKIGFISIPEWLAFVEPETYEKVKQALGPCPWSGYVGSRASKSRADLGRQYQEEFTERNQKPHKYVIRQQEEPRDRRNVYAPYRGPPRRGDPPMMRRMMHGEARLLSFDPSEADIEDDGASVVSKSDLIDLDSRAGSVGPHRGRASRRQSLGPLPMREGSQTSQIIPNPVHPKMFQNSEKLHNKHHAEAFESKNAEMAKALGVDETGPPASAPTGPKHPMTGPERLQRQISNNAKANESSHPDKSKSPPAPQQVPTKSKGNSNSRAQSQAGGKGNASASESTSKSSRRRGKDRKRDEERREGKAALKKLAEVEQKAAELEKKEADIAAREAALNAAAAAAAAGAKEVAKSVSSAATTLSSTGEDRTASSQTLAGQ